jgi:hypothetical protein
MQRTRIVRSLVSFCFVFFLGSLSARAQDVSVLATGLKAPMKVSLTAGGNLLVSEAGNGPNTGRISLVRRDGTRLTLVDGLPSGINTIGDPAPSGPSGIEAVGDAYFLAIGSGDVSLPGPTPGTEVPNPNLSSPIFSSVLKLRFSRSVDLTAGNFLLTSAQHAALKDGAELAVNNPAGETLRISLLVDFPDLVGSKSSNPFGLVSFGNRLYVAEASLNEIKSVNPDTGAYQTVATFPPLPNTAAPPGPPVVEAVPDSVRISNGQLLVSFLTGFPFVPGRAEIRRVDPSTGASQQVVGGLNSAIDVLPIPGSTDKLLALEFSTNMLAGAAGRLLLIDPAAGAPTVLAGGLATPTNMALDRNTRELFVTEFGPGRVRRITLASVIPSVLCTGNASTLCLGNGRFQARASFRTAQGTGVGVAVPLTDTTGHFWFFSADNLEVVVKVVSGCAFNSRYWVFAGGLTNVEVTLTVTDLQTGTVKTYLNPLNTAFAPIQDTAAFVCS